MARGVEKDGQSVELGDLERGNRRPADPVTLMQDNPAALIVNKESYRLMGSRFSPTRFDLPQVARVVTYSPDGEEIVKDLIIDGMTRTKYVADNLREIEKNSPSFVFRVNDVTQDVIDNPDIVSDSEKKDGQAALTLVQYLRAVIPPTVEHTKIAPDRIAAHLINGWRNMVGEQIADRYSAVAALNLLTHPSTNIATDQALQSELQKHLTQMEGITVDDRDRLQGAMVQMAQIIRQSRLNKPEVAKAAYILVASDSEVIGGEKETARQIYGMLHSPDIEKKLQKAHPGEGLGEQAQRELAREELGVRIASYFKNNRSRRNIGESMDTFNSAYQDSDLSIHQLNEILGSEKPVQRYVEIKSDINRGKLESKYRDQVRKLSKRELNDAEASLIQSLGYKLYLSDTDIPGLVRAIGAAQDIMMRARAQMAEFRNKELREMLTSQGVKPETIDQALEQVAEAGEQIATATSVRTVASKTQELQRTLEIITNKINYQRSVKTAGDIIDNKANASLVEGLGWHQVRRHMIDYVLKAHGNNLTERNIPDVRRTIEQLMSLDQRRFDDVISGRIRLGKALDDQRQRERAEPNEALIPVVVRSGVDRLPDRPVVQPQPDHTELPKSRVGPVVTEEAIVFDSRGLDEIRIETNRKKLGQLLEEMGERLSDIDLDSDELTAEEKQELMGIIDRLGELAFMRKGISQIITEEYPRLVRREIGRQEARVEDEIGDNYESTRTGR